MTSCMRSRRAFDNPDAPMEPLLPVVLFRLAEGAAEAVALLGNLRRSRSGMVSSLPSQLSPSRCDPCSAQKRGQTARLRSSVIHSHNQELALSALEEAARFKPSISILSIFSMAFMTR